MTTLVNGWRKDKRRIGDLLGEFVAIRSDRAETALFGLRGGKLSGRLSRTSRLG